MTKELSVSVAFLPRNDHFSFTRIAHVAIE